MTMRPVRILLAALLALLLVACGQPVPQDKQAYVGYWESSGEAPEMRLAISADGRLAYQRKKGSGSTSVDAPIKHFDGPNLVVGVGWFTTTFVVSKPPAENDGVWTMTVDGVVLTRRAGGMPGAPGVST